jgi:3-oxoacyl-[acyl-carrier protein] reductase
LDILTSWCATPASFITHLFLELSEEEWDEVVTVDLKGAFNCARAAIGQMVARKWGRIISVTAVTGLTGYAGLAHIGAAKTGAHGLVKSLAIEFASSGVTANAIAPGLVDTSILANFTEERLANFRRGIPVSRIGKPEEIARRRSTSLPMKLVTSLAKSST